MGDELMYTITIEHRYCGMTKTLQGESLAGIAKANNIDYKIWKVKEVEYQ